MSYTSTDLITYAVGDGTLGTIQTPPFEVDSDIVVLVRANGADTADTWVLDTDYTLAGAGTGANGTLTPITVKPSGSSIVVYTDPAPTLTFDFSALPAALRSPLTSALHQIQLQVRSLKAAQRQYIKTSIFDLVAKNNAAQTEIDTDRLGKIFAWNQITGAPEAVTPAPGVINEILIITDQIADDAVTTDKMAAGTPNRVFVTDANGDPEIGVIPNGHIVSAMIGTGEVTLEKNADGTPGYIIGYNASTGVIEERAESSGGVSTVEPIDGTAAGENITEIVIADIGTVEAKVFILDQNCDINETLPKGTAFTVRNGHASNSITMTIAAGSGGTGTFNTGGSTLAVPPNGVVFFLVDSNPGDEPVIDVRGDFATVGYGGRAVSGNLAAVVTRGAGSSQPTAADSGKWIVTDGAITIPDTEGFNCTLEFGGDHDVTHNSITWDTGAAAGDLCSVMVKSSSAIRITPLIAAADVITESDFA